MVAAVNWKAIEVLTVAGHCVTCIFSFAWFLQCSRFLSRTPVVRQRVPEPGSVLTCPEDSAEVSLLVALCTASA